MTTLVEWSQTGRASPRVARILVILEGIALLVAAPALWFPERMPLAAAALMIALAAIWLIALLYTPFPATPFNLALLLWCLALIAGITVTADPAETLPKALGLVLGLAIWRYLVIAIAARRHVFLAVGVWILMGLGFTLIGLFGLREMPKIPALAALNPVQAVTLPGLEAIAVHPNQLAGLICLILPLLVSLTASPPARLATPLRRAGLGLLTALVTVILVFTQSRGGWIAAAMGLFILLVIWAIVQPPSPSRRVMRLAAATVTVAGLLALLGVGPELRDLWLHPPEETALGTLSTLNYRRELWPWAMTAIGDFPLTGVGLGAFRHVAFRLYPLPLLAGQDIGHAHNIFLQTALDTGLPGLVAYGALLLLAAAAGWRVARRDVVFRPVALGLLAGLAALHVFGLADALALGSKPGLLFWFALGLLAAMNKEGLKP